MDALTRIKQLVIRRQVVFTKKARREIRIDNLDRDEVYESIINADAVRTIRSRSEHRKARREPMYIIVSPTFDGVEVYTKGVIRKEGDTEVFYLLISSKRSTRG